MPTDKALRKAYDVQPFERRTFPLTTKLRAARMWLHGASLRKTRDAMRHEAEFSHESVRRWAHRLSHLLRATPERREIVVVDETSLFTEDGTEVFAWVALDGETQEVLVTWVAQGRSGLEALLFMKNVLRRCKGPPPFVMVDAGVWYPWALDTLGLEWSVTCGDARNYVEAYFGSLDWRLSRMQRRPGTWHTRQSLQRLLDAHAWYWQERLL